MVRQYIGARYVPKFSDVNDGYWDNHNSYEALTIVRYGNDFYTSKKPVPVGIAIDNTEYWAQTSSFNGAINSLQVRVGTLETEFTTMDGEIDDIQDDISDIKGDVSTLQSNVGTLESDVDTLQTDVSTLQSNVSSIETNIDNIEDNIDNIESDVDTAETNITNLQTALNALGIKVTDNLSDGLAGFQCDDNFNFDTTLQGLSNNSSYTQLQGGCYNPTRNTFVLAIMNPSNESQVCLVEVQENLKTVVQRKYFTSNQLRHCNDICYNATSDKYFIAGYQTNSNNMSVIEVKASNLTFVREISLQPAVSSPEHVVGKICYDSENDVYYGMSNYEIYKYSNNWTLVSTTPFTWTTFALKPYDTVTFDAHQSIEYVDGKIACLISVQSSTSACMGGCITFYNLDGTIFSTYPISVPITGCELENISNYKGSLKVIGGSALGLFSTNFYRQKKGYTDIGRSVNQVGLELQSGTNLNDVKSCGCYMVLNNISVTNKPFNASHNIFVISTYAGFTQIAIKNDGTMCFAIRRCNYVGTWGDWTYYPKIIQSGKTYTKNVKAFGFIDGNGNPYIFLPIDELADGLTMANITFGNFAFYMPVNATVGALTLTQANQTIEKVTLDGGTGFIDIRIKNKSGTAVANAPYSAVALSGSVTFTVA